MKRIISLTLVFLMVLLLSCQTSNIKNQLIELGAIPATHTSHYLEVYKKVSITQKIYSQFETKCIIAVTPFSKEFVDAYLNERRLFLKEVDYPSFEERERQINEKNIKFFVSFYTPNPDFNDLEKTNSIWQVFIETTDNRRLLPLAIRRSSEPYPVLNHFFPSLDPWSVPYIITFPRYKNSELIIKEGEEFKLVFKSVIGTSLFTFKNI